MQNFTVKISLAITHWLIIPYGICGAASKCSIFTKSLGDTWLACDCQPCGTDHKSFLMPGGWDAIWCLRYPSICPLESPEISLPYPKVRKLVSFSLNHLQLANRFNHHFIWISSNRVNTLPSSDSATAGVLPCDSHPLHLSWSNAFWLQGLDESLN